MCARLAPMHLPDTQRALTREERSTRKANEVPDLMQLPWVFLGAENARVWEFMIQSGNRARRKVRVKGQPLRRLQFLRSRVLARTIVKQRSHSGCWWCKPSSWILPQEAFQVPGFEHRGPSKFLELNTGRFSETLSTPSPEPRHTDPHAHTRTTPRSKPQVA